MLLEFRVENHRSIREEQVLSMEHGDSVLPVAAIYGANASGKSNVLSALKFMCEAVLFSHRLWDPARDIPRDPFAWGPKRSEPSLYELTFLIGGMRAQFGFVVDNKRFVEEWVYVWPHGRKQVWYERDGDEFKFGEQLKGEVRFVEKITRENSLFLSAAVQNRHEQLWLVFGWFARLVIDGASAHLNPMAEQQVAAWLSEDSSQLSLFDEVDISGVVRMSRFREYLKAADLGIVDLRVDVEERDRRRRHKVYVRHASTVADAWLPLESESSGTRSLFELAPKIIRALDGGGVLVVDELGASFHPLLALEIVRTFNDPKRNPKNAQLIFSTHDTNLLGTTLGEPLLRREQVWLTEKSSQGATVLYPLTDYKPRKEENLERGYLQGRYGAIPFLGGLAERPE